jgi:hypothetical protein
MDMPPEPGRPPLSGLRPHFLPFLFLFFSSFLSFFFFSFLFLFFSFSFLFFSSSLGEHEITAGQGSYSVLPFLTTRSPFLTTS